jgi:teichuronic acid biosynthesis glycosyltransferase TuaC
MNITNHYPTALLPHDGITIQKVAAELQKTDKVSQQIILPLPAFPHFKKTLKAYKQYEDFPAKDIQDGIEIFYPRYFMVPGGYFTNVAQSMAKEIETIVASQNPDVIEGQNLYPAGVAAFKVAKNNDLPFILTIRDRDPERWFDNDKVGGELLDATDYAKKIICETETIKNTVLSYGIAEEKIVVINNGIDTDIFNVEVKANPLREKYFLTVGSLTTEKAHHVTLNAIAGIKKERLIIIGDGHQRRELKKQARDLGINGRVQFIKHLEQSKLAEFYAGATTTILMGYDEGMVNTIHESLACGTPVIAPDVGDIRAIINDTNGILLKDNDDYHLIEATKKVKAIQYNRPEISTSNVNKNWPNITKKLLQIYTEVKP